MWSARWCSPRRPNFIAEHHARGHDVVLISASGRELVEPIERLLGVDHVVASELRGADGRYTVEREFYCYGEEKAVAMHAMARTTTGWDGAMPSPP